MKRHDQISACILCGGTSSRMGAAKGLLKFGDQPLILRIAGILEPLVSAVTLVGPRECYGHLGLHMVEDADLGIKDEKGKSAGPLLGIASALISTRTEWNLILACDLPYLTAEWLDWLLARAVASNCQIVMPRTARGLEPLAAVYRPECAQPIIETLRRGVHKVSDALEQFRIEFVAEGNWAHIELTGRVLYNMNAPEDYQEAQRWLEGKQPAIGDQACPGDHLAHKPIPD